MRFIAFIIFIATTNAFAIPCNCELIVQSPISGPNRHEPNTLKNYDLESYDTYRVKNQYACREACQDAFHSDMPTRRLNALLVKYSKSLIDEKVIGHNCTGLTTLKYPIRVKASLGRLGLGNVIDQTHVINHEEVCF
jgi:hypothetical protein